MAQWDLTMVGSALVHDSDGGLYNSIAQIDSTHFLVTYAGLSSDGYITVLAVDNSTKAVTEPFGALEFDVSNGTFNALYKIDSTHFLNVWAGSGNDGFAQVFTVNTGTWEVTAEGSALEFDTIQSLYNTITQVDSNHFLVARAGTGGNNMVTILEVNLSTWAITDQGDTTLRIDPGAFRTGATFAVQMVDSTHALIASTDGDNDGWLDSISINTSTWAITVVDSFEFDTDTGVSPAMVEVSTGKFILTWSSSSNTGYARVFDINLSTYAITAAGSQYTISTTDRQDNSDIQKIDSNHFLIVYGRLTATGSFARVLEVNLSTYAITEVGTSLEFESNNCFSPILSEQATGYFLLVWGDSTNTQGEAQIISVEISEPTPPVASEFTPRIIYY